MLHPNSLDAGNRPPLSPRLGATVTSPRLGHHRRNSSDEPAWISTARGGSRYTNAASIKAVLLRPIYLISRRGPLVPALLLVALVVVILTYSTNPSTAAVKRRVQGAVGPYIPQRAADAINWRGRQQQIVKLDEEEEEFARARKGKPGERKKKVVASTPLAAPRKDGRILIENGKQHPIPKLMKRAKQQWATLQAKQSKTFKDAVAEYVKRNGQRPPKGFDKWYAFAKANKVHLIDEFDLINKDLSMYRAFTPEAFRARVKFLPTHLDTTWTIRVEAGKAVREGQLANHDRARGVVDLMTRFVHELPDMTVVYNGHDGARIAVAWEERERLEDLISTGDVDDAPAAEPFWPKHHGPEPHWGMPVFCPPESAVRAPGFDYGWAPMDSTGLEMPPLPAHAIGTLVDSLSVYLNVCENPQFRHYHATTSWVYSHHPTPVMPLFTPGVQVTFGDIHGLIVEQLDMESQHDPTWEERPFTSLQWRGQTSGPLWEKNSPWKSTHRARLHLLSHQETSSRNIILTDDDDIARVVEVPNYRLNPLFLDTGMVGPAVQCVKEDGTCDKMYEVFMGYDKRISFDRASLYKYVLDVDGNSWSGRFRRLMMSNAAVVKSTIFPEFWTDWAIPWIHFIPMQVDYSDMWDILAFFRGGMHGEGAHDDLGREIAMAGKEWVRLCYRWEDLEAYQYRLLLEYARLYNDETSPGSKDFHGDESVEPIWEGLAE